MGGGGALARLWRVRGATYAGAMQGMSLPRALALAAAALLACAGAAAADDPTRVAVFDFELIDTSLEGEMMGPQATETERLGRLGERLREAVAGADGFEVVPIAPVAEEARARNLQGCGGCDRELAERLGADWAVTGTVQKVSNLILNVNLYVREVDSGETVQTMSADIRGNTDESWQRGLDWLIRNRLDLDG